MAKPCLYASCRKALSISNLNRRLAIRSLSTSHTSHTTTIQEHQEDEAPIVLPKRIVRGPTDILKALNDTLLTSTTSTVPYKYHDDPFLIPSSNVAKRSFALAKESGKKSARFFLENFPNQFYHNTAEPNIEAFVYQEKVTKDTKVTEKMLEKLIVTRRVEDAIQAYRNLTADGGEIKDDNLLHNFFEMICFYGCREPQSEEDLETIWFQQPIFEKRKTWPTDDCLADEMFKSTTIKSARFYNAYLLGLLKHHDIKRGLLIYNTMQKENIPVVRAAYNHLISTLPYQTENLESRWNMAKDYMKTMADKKISPDLHTFNAALETLTKCQNWPGARNAARNIFAEMKTLNIAPSLASYYFIMSLFTIKGRRADSNMDSILPEILDKIRNQKMEIKHPMDVHFLTAAMEMTSMVYKSKQMGHDLHSFYLNNPHFIGCAYNENLYYYYFFRLLLNTESIDNFFEYYHFYIPYRYTPEPNLILNILKKIDLSYAYHHLPQLWKDIILFNQYKNLRIMDNMLEMMARESNDPTINQSFVMIAADLKERIDIELERGTLKAYPWTGQSLGHLLTIFLNGGDMKMSEEALSELLKKKGVLMDQPSEACLKLCCQMFLSNNMPEHALKCVEYAVSTCSYTKLGQEILKVSQQHNLSDKQRTKLDAIIGAPTPIEPLPEETKTE